MFLSYETQMHLQKINDSGLLIALLMFIDFIKATVAQTVNAPVQIRHLVQQLPAIYKKTAEPITPSKSTSNI